MKGGREEGKKQGWNEGKKREREGGREKKEGREDYTYIL